MITKENSKVVKVQVGPGSEVLARRGAMLGYQGDVRFRPVANGGQGVGGMMGRVLAGESVPLMLAEGQGEVLYGFRGLHVHPVELDGSESLQVEASRLLLHDANLSSSIVTTASQGGSSGGGFLRSAARAVTTGQGLATTQLSGRGSVALLAHGGIFEIRLTGAPLTVDPQAYVAHRGAVRLDFALAASWRDAVGRGSGEATQLRITGDGVVYVQGSEEKL